MDPPFDLLPRLVAAALPAAAASVFAAASTASAGLSEARKRTLSEVLPRGPARALSRYLEQGSVIEARWMVMRILGITLSALALRDALPDQLGAWRWVFASLTTLVAFGIPAQMARAVATRTAETTAPLLIRWLWPFELLAAPIAAPLHWLGQRGRSDAPLGCDENAEVIGSQSGTGNIAQQEASKLGNTLGLGELVVGAIMVPRAHVSAIGLHQSTAEVINRVIAEGHSRYPVYEGRIDNVVGILNVKDLLSFLTGGQPLDSLELPRLLHHPVLFVPETRPALDLLREMRHHGQHLAVVLGEFGGMSGIVTQEDLLQRIVGDTRDQPDREEPLIVELGAGRLMVDAAIPIVDLARYLGQFLPVDGNDKSLGELIVSHLGSVPPVGTRFSAFELDFVIRGSDQRQVSRVEVSHRLEAKSIAPRSGRPPPD